MVYVKTVRMKHLANEMHHWAEWLSVQLARKSSETISFRFLLRCEKCKKLVRGTPWRGTINPCYTGFCKGCNIPIMSPQGNTCCYCTFRTDCLVWGRAKLEGEKNDTT